MDNLLALVIEDEAYLADIFSEAMQAAGFMTEMINHGLTARQRICEIVPDIIVLDLHLPGIDGVHLLNEIHNDTRLANTIVIVATADHNLALNLREKATLVLLKPISFSQLRDLAIRFKGMPRQSITVS